MRHPVCNSAILTALQTVWPGSNIDRVVAGEGWHGGVEGKVVAWIVDFLGAMLCAQMHTIVYPHCELLSFTYVDGLLHCRLVLSSRTL